MSSHHHLANTITTRIKVIGMKKSLKMADPNKLDYSLTQPCYQNCV